MQGFWRTVSIRACDRIARWAQAGAADPRVLPSAEALMKLSGASIAYSNPTSSGLPVTAEAALAELRQLRSKLAAAAGARSTRPTAPTRGAAAAEQPAHLRRAGVEPHPAPRPRR
ncbi:hypothetical protein FH609_027825 [Streptomyces sp. 3MP-14]|uniref:Uncharacterized protein n=1 Tax=Streptomyces mimosae TaxID=2586635 RepID=A0A5N5ZWQ1_9ACTN|nr:MULTISPECIES: hypothetical protein [Streptomyces]KAB8160322.1 hypothetical protein FH607_027340 [Streptomyces mimosae]KAB8172916.1 hypothetical protein FH609_027825 [Streptomyces sp. 3MP-14]